MRASVLLVSLMLSGCLEPSEPIEPTRCGFDHGDDYASNVQLVEPSCGTACSEELEEPREALAWCDEHDVRCLSREAALCRGAEKLPAGNDYRARLSVHAAVGAIWQVQVLLPPDDDGLRSSVVVLDAVSGIELDRYDVIVTSP